ncbi:MAG: cupin domain-containing protein [Candidatus Velthaea sp.]
MQQTVVDGVWMWSRWQADRAMYFNSFLVTGPGGSFVVDPLDPDDDAVFARCGEARPQAVVITNRDHERAASRFAREFSAPVIASAPDAPLLGIAVDRTVTTDDDVFGWRVIVLDGFKTPGEMVLFAPRLRAAISGDAFWGAPAGSLRLMPDAKLADPARAALSARALRTLRLRHLLVGDGAPVLGNAAEVFGAMLDARDGVLVRRINVDELHAQRDPADPAPFNGAWAEIGFTIGAAKLGYGLTTLAPGQSFCPYHWHTAEEEVFLVWDGTPTLRTPGGTFVLRRGDFVAFPTGERGAHRLWNASDAPCTVVMLADTDAGDVCYYPDSGKHVVEATGTLVRSTPQVDYFDGE